ncbi:di-trans,poly-cis-decaprenylcistransferase [Candidatus Aerophobetes bacterium]|uniref:Isoprenyl transferase n=1 Tax=Aerophobetes bacterium TaxID=2030807 RepID=A0A2A4X1I5_UNCAE|nr:MAG: di-trans,poly-cis-decaprenylcistransferase [Candidatus Aerophobetes bacterium]
MQELILERESLYSPEQLRQLDKVSIPRHIAIIMDGNRRWATKLGKAAFQGHYQGAKQLGNIVQAAAEIGVSTLTVFAFSTENWKRSEKEVAVLMRILKSQILEQKETMKEEGVRLSFIGDMTRLPKGLVSVMKEAAEYTKEGTNLELVMAINYGGRDEVVRATRKIVDAIGKGEMSAQDIDERVFESYLDTAHTPPPELVIRTSGEYRLSNFLLWQLSYSEVFFLDLCWPEFSHIHFLDVVLTFQKRNRRYGG